MSNILNFKVFFYVIFAYLCGSALIGKSFYQTQYAGLYLSDILFLFAASIFLIYEVKKKKIFFPVELKLLVAFISISLSTSLFVTDFTVYLTLRQGYHLISLICFIMFVSSLDGLKFNKLEQRIIPITLFLIIFSSIIFEPGYADSLVVLLLIIAALSDKKTQPILYICFFGIIFVAEHAITILASLSFFAILLFLTNRRIFIFSAFLALPIFLIIVAIIGPNELYNSIVDHNVTWRAIYWAEIVNMTISNGALFSGNGYGILYINPEFLQFDRLIQQISNYENSFTQAQVVSPHNSLIVFFYHLGLLGLLLFVIFLVRASLVVIKAGNKWDIALFLSSAPWIISHNMLELPQVSLGFAFALSIIINRSILVNSKN